MTPAPPRDPLSKEQRSAVMRRIHRRDTKPELALRTELTRRGLRYRLDYGRAPGRPDIAFVGRRLAVFVDGEFWHGKKLSPERLKMMSPYWQKKIERNVARDRRANHELTHDGWTVIRVTDRAIRERIDRIGAYIERATQNRFRGYRPPGLELFRP